MGMILTDEQQAILDGAKGETMAKVMKTLVMFGEAFHAEKMVPVTSRYNHLVTSFGLGVLQPVYDLMQQLIDAGAVSGQKFSADPRPLDPNVPANLLQQLVFKKFMYNKQDFYEGQLQKLGLMDKDAFTCTCYMPEVGNKPEKGEILSWSESSAVVYANSVLGARCNRNSGILDIMGSIVGYVPYFGLLTDEGRKATWIVKIETSKKPEAQLLGSAIGMKVMEDVPYVAGLDKWLGTELDDAACTYLKDFGAATASNGAVGLYHIANLTPEAKELGEALIAPTRIYVKALKSIKNAGVRVHACSHITGGGFYENIPRMLKEGTRAVVEKNSYPVLPIFKLLAEKGNIDEQMMYNTYNMGLGMILAVDAADVDKTMEAIKAAGDTPYVVGRIEDGEKGVTLC